MGLRTDWSMTARLPIRKNCTCWHQSVYRLVLFIFKEDCMNLLMENLYIILLGLVAFCLILSYFYSKAYSTKSIFQNSADYVEIRTWRKK